jgi:anti-sigma factor RsiW
VTRPGSHVEDRLPAYLDGRLDPAEQTRISAHLDACAECARAADELRAVGRLLDADAAPSPAPMGPAIARRRDPVRRRAAGMGFALATAASLAAGFALGLLAVRDGAAPAATDATASEAADAELLVTSETTLSEVYFLDGANGAGGAR